MTDLVIHRTDWGVMHHRDPWVLHRGPMTETEARKWIREWLEDGGQPDAFRLVRRAVLMSYWTPADAGSAHSTAHRTAERHA